MSTQRILIVEDDADGQEVVATIVNALQLPYDVAGDAAQALELLAAYGSQYQAAIIDLALPGQVDGLQLIAHIRADSTLHALPCLAITAFHTSKLREQALQAGFNAYLAKPLDPHTLAAQLQELL